MSYSAPNVSYGTATVDGNINDWDLIQDLFAPMYIGGDSTKTLTSNVYLKYDCNQHVLYVLVLITNPLIPGLKSPDDAWAYVNNKNDKVYTGNSDNNGIPPDFAWVGVGFDGNQDHVQGYEASFSINPGNYYNIVFHLEVLGNNTSATTGFKNVPVSINLICTSTENPGIKIVKATNGSDNDTAPGLVLCKGDPVTWTYTVTNTGNVPLSQVTVVDDQPGVSPNYSSGDTNNNGLLDLTETWIYTASGTAIAGQYTNVGTVSGTSPLETTVIWSNPDNYFGEEHCRGIKFYLD
ncbi:MAG: hypothetical protein PHD02_05145 [Bacilli bacterium]|nr:hypothetical protein [Bacilli bacterium]